MFQFYPSRFNNDKSSAFVEAAAPPRLDYPNFKSSIDVRDYVPSLHSHPKIYERIFTPYNPSKFESLLRKHNLTSSYPLLVQNLRKGFPLGPMPPLTTTNIIDNKPSTAKHMDLIEEELTKEVKSGRMDGPFPKEMIQRILRGPFQSSPLIVVVQPEKPGEPPKVRICRDLSRNANNMVSVNSFIKRAELPTRLDTVYRVADIISFAPPGTQACVLDIAKFHRTCPILPDHKCWLVVQGRPGQFYIDHVFPFGTASASSNAGMIANAMVDIWMAEGIKPILKYEDDISCFRYPNPKGAYPSYNGLRYDYNRKSMLKHIAPLNVPWHPDKGDKEFTFYITFLGLAWDLANRTVSLPEDKRVKFLSEVNVFITLCSQGECHLRDVEHIHGLLCYATFVYPAGRSYLPSLSNFATSFKDDENATRKPHTSVITDLRWWRATLQQIGVFRKLIPRGPAMDLAIYVAADTSWGIAVVIDDRWAAFQLSSTWKDTGKGETWLETLAVEFAIYFLEAMGHRESSFLIHCNNKGTMGAMLKGRSGNYGINYSVRRSYTVLSSLYLSPSFDVVPPEDNPAEPLSRGKSGLRKNKQNLKFQLPSELKSIFYRNASFL